MANEKISEYTPLLEIDPTDLQDVSEDTGGGNFSTKSITNYLARGGVKVSKVFGDFSNASLVFDISVFTLKAGRKLLEFVLKHESLWGDGAVNITSVVVELGIVGNEGIYMFEPFDILQATGDTILINEEPNAIENWNSDTDIRMRITAIGDDLDQLTTGSIDLFIFTKAMKP